MHKEYEKCNLRQISDLEGYSFEDQCEEIPRYNVKSFQAKVDRCSTFKIQCNKKLERLQQS